jgi:hypothetical protein
VKVDRQVRLTPAAPITATTVTMALQDILASRASAANGRAQFDALKICLVGLVGIFAPQSTINVIVERAQHPLARERAQVFDARDFGRAGTPVARLCRTPARKHAPE